MKKRIKILLLALGGLAVALFVLLWLMPAPRTITKQQLKAEYTRAAQRLYRHEILGLFKPPEEAFTPHGLQLLRRIQELNSAVFLPYLVMGSVPVQPDVLYNPWFDLFILVEDSDGEINSVGLASSLTAGQAPQLQVQEKFWQELYRRYPVAQMATFAQPKTFENTSRVILEMRNLTNRFGWPSRVQLTPARVSFELYIQRPTQAIYCSPTEPGTYVVFNYCNDRLHTNAMVLPPYHVRQIEKLIEETAKKRPRPSAPILN